MSYFEFQFLVAGVASVFPAGSLARTWKVWDPLGKAVYVLGLVHAAKAAVSSLHSKVEPASVAVNVNVAVFGLLLPLGPPVIVVSGAVVSMVHVALAGNASVLPTASFARTENVCDPVASPE